MFLFSKLHTRLKMKIVLSEKSNPVVFASAAELNAAIFETTTLRNRIKQKIEFRSFAAMTQRARREKRYLIGSLIAGSSSRQFATLFTHSRSVIDVRNTFCCSLFSLNFISYVSRTSNYHSATLWNLKAIFGFFIVSFQNQFDGMSWIIH